MFAWDPDGFGYWGERTRTPISRTKTSRPGLLDDPPSGLAGSIRSAAIDEEASRGYSKRRTVPTGSNSQPTSFGTAACSTAANVGRLASISRTNSSTGVSSATPFA
jgi:hypothetical protein